MRYVDCNVCGKDNWFVRLSSTLGNGSQPEVEAFRCTSSGYGEHTQIVECAVCGHVYANPTWEDEELLTAYEDVEDEVYVSERAGRVLTFKKHLAHLEKFTGKGLGRDLLDVGAYVGVFVQVAQEAGWNAMGIEPSSWAVDHAKTNGLAIYEGTLDSGILVGKKFDVITMWDVIEHVQYPKQELEKAFALLKPGGMIAVHTMDISSPTARLMGKRWPWYMAMHVHYFGRESLGRVLTDVGYDIVWSGTEGRYLRMGYLATRLGGLNRGVGSLAHDLVQRFELGETAVPINFGDLFTVIAQRPV